jgi:hypothetical protein
MSSGPAVLLHRLHGDLVSRGVRCQPVEGLPRRRHVHVHVHVEVCPLPDQVHQLGEHLGAVRRRRARAGKLGQHLTCRRERRGQVPLITFAVQQPVDRRPEARQYVRQSYPFGCGEHAEHVR